MEITVTAGENKAYAWTEVIFFCVVFFRVLRAAQLDVCVSTTSIVAAKTTRTVTYHAHLLTCLPIRESCSKS